MKAQAMLRQLGYGVDADSVRVFQRDYNRMASDPILVTGELDDDTEAAVRFAFNARAVFTNLRDGQKG